MQFSSLRADFTPPQREHAWGWAPPASAPRTAPALQAQRAPRLTLTHGHPTGHPSQHGTPWPGPQHPLGSFHSPRSPSSSLQLRRAARCLPAQGEHPQHPMLLKAPSSDPAASSSYDILPCSLRAVKARQPEQPPQHRCASGSPLSTEPRHCRREFCSEQSASIRARSCVPSAKLQMSLVKGCRVLILRNPHVRSPHVFMLPPQAIPCLPLSRQGGDRTGGACVTGCA